MAIRFDQRETSSGPLDIAKNGTEDLDLTTPTETVSEDPMSNSADREHARNPLGYTVTEPTEEEMEGRSSPRGVGGGMIHSDPNTDEAEVEKSHS